jgi:hypothetical protein
MINPQNLSRILISIHRKAIKGAGHEFSTPRLGRKLQLPIVRVSEKKFGRSTLPRMIGIQEMSDAAMSLPDLINGLFGSNVSFDNR